MRKWPQNREPKKKMQPKRWVKIAKWMGVGGAGGLVTVCDWSIVPTPWLAFSPPPQEVRPARGGIPRWGPFVLIFGRMREVLMINWPEIGKKIWVFDPKTIDESNITFLGANDTVIWEKWTECWECAGESDRVTYPYRRPYFRIRSSVRFRG